jgi:hypothetical protein
MAKIGLKGDKTMAKINSFNFGFIVVDDKQYAHDVIILPDGSVLDRHPGKGRLGSHTISKSEIETLSKEPVDAILIGSGVQGMARLAHDAEHLMLDPELNITMLPSTQIVKKYNQHVEDGDKVAALIHVTC